MLGNNTIEDLQKSFIHNLSEYFKSYKNRGCGIKVFCTLTDSGDTCGSELDLFGDCDKFIEVVRITLEIYDLEKKVLEKVREGIDDAKV